MKGNYILTAAQAEEKMKCYGEIFSVVRILKKDQIPEICSKTDAKKQGCPCYSFWERSEPCENCVSARAVLSKTDEVKLEFARSGIYQVIAHYLEIDGEPCVMELLRAFDKHNFIDLSGEEKLLSHINEYYEKTYTDVMTGVYNRRFYEEKLKNSVLNAGVAMIDLDDFKVYNDVYGHVAGDAVLTKFAEMVKKSIRATDKLIRYGGDEFLLIMPGVREHGFDSALQHILQSIKDIVFPGYEGIKLTTSIGATVSVGEPVHVAVGRADRLLYRAKTQKNVIVTDEGGETVEMKSKATILIVDDSALNRDILSSILSNEFNIIEATGGKECVEIIKKQETKISVILLDIMMPGMDGFDVLKYMSDHHLIESIPVITITGDESNQTIQKAYEMGVSDFIARPFDTKVVYRRVVNTINLYEKQKRLISTVSNEILEKEKNSQILVNVLSQVAEFGADTGREHITNINKITELLLVRLREKTAKYALNDKDVYMITTASSLHDIGKVGVDHTILNKPGKLTAEEFEEVKRHTVIGAEMVTNISEYRNEPLVRYAHDICLYHHEKYDGKGYPEGLVGDNIPIAAQVVSLADVYDALTADRVYKKAYSADKALKMIIDGECGRFNPILLECLLDVRRFLTKDENGVIK